MLINTHIKLLLVLLLGHLPLLNNNNSAFIESSSPTKENRFKIGELIDVYNKVPVYYNGKRSNVLGRNITEDGYNLGLKYQCVEFVKRYYYIIYNHKMPDAFGNAKDLYNKEIQDGLVNPQRGLIQYTNGSKERPLPGDILIFGPSHNNKFGHTGIVCYSKGQVIEIIQQNVGHHSRSSYSLVYYEGLYYVSDKSILGWLRK